LYLLEGLHDCLRKGDGVDVVVRILFEQQSELLPGSVLAPKYLRASKRTTEFAARGTTPPTRDSRPLAAFA
jgi:hypothetical protein